jgi:uncharacterized protein YlaI
MGSRLYLDPNDPFLKNIDNKPIGISGGCYCCGKQIHLDFKNLNVLPTAKINNLPYQILICDECEEDLEYLENLGINNLSYDLLFFIQEDLNEELANFDLDNGGYNEKDRKRILVKIYKRYSKKF